MKEEQPILTNREQYRFELFQLHRLTPEEETLLVQQARSPDLNAREALITSCLRYVAYIAWRYHPFARKSDDYLDLVGVGNLALVENMDRALTKPNPIAYLFVCAKWAIFRYCIYRSDLIARTRKDKTMQVESLDSSLSNGQPLERIAKDHQAQSEQDYSDLYDAINLLDDKYRLVVLRHYGLDGDAPESLTAISKRLSPNPKQSIAYLRLSRSLIRLRLLLTTQKSIT